MILKLMLVWVLSTLGGSLVFAECEGVQGQALHLCRGLRAAERFESCDHFRDLDELNSCRALTTLIQGRSCAELKLDQAPFLVCSMIHLGLMDSQLHFPESFKNTFDRLVSSQISETSLTGYRAFGNYLSAFHPLFLEARRQNRAALGISQFQQFSSKSKKLGPNEERKAGSLASHLDSRLRILSKERVFHSTKTVLSFSREIVKFVEGSRSSWVTTSSTVPLYLNLDADQSIPCNIQMNPGGKVIVHLDRIRIDGSTYPLAALGSGAYKSVFLAFDYDSAVAGFDFKKRNEPFLALGQPKDCRIGLESDPTAYRDMGILQSKTALREQRIHSSIGHETEIADAGKVFLKVPESVDPMHMSVVQNFYPATLRQWIEKTKNRLYVEGYPVWKVKIKLAKDLLRALSIIHSGRIHHRDIKPENILISYDEKGLPRAHLADFGLALNLNQLSFDEPFLCPTGVTSPECTRWIRSEDLFSQIDFSGVDDPTIFMKSLDPTSLRVRGEILSNNDLSNDVWGMGLVLYSLMNPGWRYLPSRPCSASQIASIRDYSALYRILGIHRPIQNDPVMRVIYRMLDPDPTSRVSATEALFMINAVYNANNLALDPGFTFTWAGTSCFGCQVQKAAPDLANSLLLVEIDILALELIEDVQLTKP